MNNETLAQIEALWIRNGGAAEAAPTAGAIAYAESGGNPGSIGYYSPSLGYDTATPTADTSQTDEGLWQIANLHVGLSGANVSQDLLNPATNAAQAVNLSGGGADFSAWSTYKNGAYLSYEQQANAALPQAEQLAQMPFSEFWQNWKNGNIGGIVQGISGGISAPNAGNVASNIFGLGPAQTNYSAFLIVGIGLVLAALFLLKE